MKKEEYEKTKNKLLKEKKLYEDPSFPATRKSLFYSNMNEDMEIVWKRPFELTKAPRMFIDGPSRWDSIQGSIGNCWFVSALASCSLYPKIIERIIPDNQTFYTDYCGMFYIRFWQFGQWVTIVIDDRLPVDATTGNLVFMQSVRKEEFWSSIVEKAIAKLYGCYENLHGGRPTSGLLDLTGGITEWFRTSLLPADFYSRLLKYRSSNCILSCGIMSSSREQQSEQVIDGNLLSRHAYSMTDVRIVEFLTKSKDLVRHELVRIKNPWGEVEWSGAWSKKSAHWRNIPAKKRVSLGLTVDEDGEFWMSWQDFRKNFTDIYICYVEPEMLGTKSDPAVRWEPISYVGSWTTEIPQTTNILLYSKSAFLNPTGTIRFSVFPQFKINLSEPDFQSKECELVVALLQRSQRYHMQQGIAMHPIGYYLFRMRKHNDKVPQPDSFFAQNRPTAYSRMSDSQEITTRFKLSPGTYVVIPVTGADHKGEFLLRMCYEKRGHIWGHVVMSSKGATDHAALTDYGWNVHTVPKIYVPSPSAAPRTSLTGAYVIQPAMMDFIHQEPMPGNIPRHQGISRLRLESESHRVPKLSPPKMLGLPAVKRHGSSCAEHLKKNNLYLRGSAINRLRIDELYLQENGVLNLENRSSIVDPGTDTTKLPDWRKFHDTMMNAVSTKSGENYEVQDSLYDVSGLLWYKD